ncbi:hypothetical protein ACJ73_00692 [Blastomyces percursus]|uniref:Uncharacterized protein n=1 Tax=Blastomyces percursus TaxID=1658174 RepID=A0A1J9R6B9_9EURO|nr:hypothetical protein ACJ73_00692 [Blastomyces percursus]
MPFAGTLQADVLERVRKGDFNYDHYRTLARLVIQKEPDVDIWKAVPTSRLPSHDRPLRRMAEVQMLSVILLCSSGIIGVSPA